MPWLFLSVLNGLLGKKGRRKIGQRRIKGLAFRLLLHFFSPSYLGSLTIKVPTPRLFTKLLSPFVLHIPRLHCVMQCKRRHFYLEAGCGGFGR